MRVSPIASTVDKLTAVMAEQAGSDQFEELITAAGALVKGLRTYAVDTNQSAIQDTLGQEAAIKTALAANEALEANQKKFFDGMCDELQLDRTPPYDPGKECTWELISATVKAKAKAVVDACAEKNKSGGWLDALNAIAAVCPYVSAGVTAFKGFNTLLKKGEQGETYLKLLVPKSSDAFKGSLQAMRDNEGWINLVGKAAEGFNKGKGKVKSGLDTLGLLNEDCPSLSGEAAAARAMLMNLRTSLALVDSMAVEAQTIEAITVSSTSTLHFQVANEQANANLITVADDAVTTVKKWNKDAAAEKRAQYIAEGCAIARESVRAGQVELIDMAHRLQTAAGWPRTSPLPVIPRRAVGSSTDVSVPLITTLWAPIAISSWFDTMTNSGSIADAAAQRFVSLVDLVTNKGTSEGDAIPSMIFYVKKRVTGPDLEYFKNYGNLKFAVGLEDLVRSGNEFDYWDARITGESWLPLLSSTWLPLSTPYALAVAYSGCFGADPLEPCCTGAGCRGKVIGNAPWSTRLGTAAMPTTSGCTSPEEWSTSASPLEQTTRSSGGKTTALFDTRTCLAPVRTDPKSVKMLEAAIDSAASPQGVVDEIQDSLALTTPRALAFGGVQGSPLYGDWAINVNEEAAAALREHSADETIAPSTPPTTDEGWRNDNAALKGIEVFIIVGVEPLAPSAAPKYESSAYPNATWRWWEPLRP